MEIFICIKALSIYTNYIEIKLYQKIGLMEIGFHSMNLEMRHARARQ